MVVYYFLKKRFRKIRWGQKVNGTRLFGSFQRKISGSNGTSEKAVLFIRTECSHRKFVFLFFKAIFDTSSRPSRPFFLIRKNGKRDSGTNPQSRGEVRRYVTMVARFLDLNNLSWQWWPIALSNDGWKAWAIVLFLKWNQSQESRRCQFFFAFFRTIFAGPRFIATQKFVTMATRSKRLFLSILLTLAHVKDNQYLVEYRVNTYMTGLPTTIKSRYTSLPEGPEIVTLQGQLIFFPASTVSDHCSSNFWETCLPGIAVISWSMSDFFMGLSLSSASSVLDTISWSVANWWTLDKALKKKNQRCLLYPIILGRMRSLQISQTKQYMNDPTMSSSLKTKASVFLTGQWKYSLRRKRNQTTPITNVCEAAPSIHQTNCFIIDAITVTWIQLKWNCVWFGFQRTVPNNKERKAIWKIKETKLYQAGLCILRNSMLCCKEFGRNTCGKLFFLPLHPFPGCWWQPYPTLPHNFASQWGILPITSFTRGRFDKKLGSD